MFVYAVNSRPPFVVIALAAIAICFASLLPTQAHASTPNCAAAALGTKETDAVLTKIIDLENLIRSRPASQSSKLLYAQLNAKMQEAQSLGFDLSRLDSLRGQAPNRQAQQVQQEAVEREAAFNQTYDDFDWTEAETWKSASRRDYNIRLSGDLKQMIVADSNGVALYKTYDDKDQMGEHTKGKEYINIDPTGTYAIIGTPSGAKAGKTSDFEEMESVAMEGNADAVAINAKGDWIAGARSGKVRVGSLQANSDFAIRMKAITEKEVFAVRAEFSNDGEWLIVFWSDELYAMEHHISVWKTRTGKEVTRLKLADYDSHTFAISANGSRFVVGYDQSHLRVLETATGKVIYDKDLEDRGGADAVTLSPEGRHLIFGNGEGHIFEENIATGKVRTVQGEFNYPIKYLFHHEKEHKFIAVDQNNMIHEFQK